MGVLTTFLALLSCVLIGTGIWLVLRDARRSKARQAAQTRAAMRDTPVVPDGARVGGARHERGEPASAAAPLPALSEISPAAAPPTDDRTAEDRAHFELRIPWQHSLPAALASALRAVNGAFEPAGIVLVPDAAAGADPASAAPPALAVSLMAQAQPAGSLQVTVAGDAIEITAWSGSGAADEVRRVRSLNCAGATIPALAEAIAACAWPVVAAAMSRNPTTR